MELQYSRVSDAGRSLPTTLHKLLEQCTLLVQPIPESVLSSYCERRSDRTSAAAVAAIVSSTQVTSAQGTRKLNKFRLSDIYVGSRPHFVSVSLDLALLRSMVRPMFPGGEEAFDSFMVQRCQELSRVRAIIYSIKSDVLGLSDSAVWLEFRVQCIMQLYLNHFLSEWGVGLTVQPANTDFLEFTLLNNNQDEETWRGAADLKCVDGLNKEHSTLEIKVPFAFSDPRLYHSKALQPKQQLLGQAIGYCKAKGCPVLSYLTDLVAMSVMWFDGETAYLSQRVTYEEGFCLKLTLMCCNFDVDKLCRLFANRSGTAVNLENDNVEEHESLHTSNQNVENESDNRGPAARTRSQTASHAGNDGATTKQHHITPTTGTGVDVGVKWRSFDDDDEEAAHNRRLDDISAMLRWDAKCRGAVYLDYNALHSNR